MIVLAFAPVPIFTAPVVPESKLMALVVVLFRVSVEPPVKVRAPVEDIVVVVPTLIVPLPAWTVKFPAAVDHVAAAADVRVSAPVEVVNELAALPVRDTAPPLVVMPALPVISELNVLAPANVWVVVVTTPPKLASAG